MGAPKVAQNRRLLGRYEVGPLVARGGMAAVYRASDLRLGRTVALKRLREDLAADPVARTRFDNEARAAARLNHPNVVTVLDVGTDAEGVPFLVLEWLPGSTLADEIADGALRPNRVHTIGLQMLAALAEAHDHGVLHRDVKPSNIILTATGDAKLADFGIAKTLDGQDVTTTGDVIGTIRYLAPERLRGQPATRASDLYSLGMVLREAATGTVAMSAEPLAPLSSRDLGPLAAVINRATTQRPEDRYASATEMAAALVAGEGTRRDAPEARTAPLASGRRAAPEATLATTEVALAPTATYSRGFESRTRKYSSVSPPGGRRRIGLFLAFVLVALIAAGALAWGLSPRSSSPDPTTVPVTTTVPTVSTTSAPAVIGPSTRPTVGASAGQGHGQKDGKKHGNGQGDQ